jgi:NDP-sugar pyrophosphorylase family protein
VRRIASRFELGGERRAGVYVSINLIAARAFDTLPGRDVFVHLDDWLAPLLRAGAQDVRGELLDDCTWAPVGDPTEYLAANLHPTPVGYFDADEQARALGARLEPDLVIGPGAELGAGAHLRRAVVWERERVPAGLRASGGVFAGGCFHQIEPTA